MRTGTGLDCQGALRAARLDRRVGGRPKRRGPQAVSGDYFPAGHRRKPSLKGKGGKERTIPVHHKLEEYLSAYLEEAGLDGRKDEPFFQSLSRSRELTGRRLIPENARQMVKRRAADAGFDPDEVTCYTFRGTGITTYLENGGELETAQHIAGHNSATTTKLYYRRQQNVEQEEIERDRI